MTIAEFEQVLSKGENLTVEFKTWIYAKDMRERISLACFSGKTQEKFYS